MLIRILKAAICTWNQLSFKAYNIKFLLIQAIYCNELF